MLKEKEKGKIIRKTQRNKVKQIQRIQKKKRWND